MSSLTMFRSLMTTKKFENKNEMRTDRAIITQKKIESNNITITSQLSDNQTKDLATKSNEKEDQKVNYSNKSLNLGETS